MKVLLICLISLFCVEQVLAERTRWHQLADYTFDQYVKEFGKSYASALEYEERRIIFNDKLEKIQAHNSDVTKTWKEGVNHLTDHSPEELKFMLGNKRASDSSTTKRIQLPPVLESEVLDAPTDVDWRTKGIVTAVKDQGHCGSCWAFATVECVESYYAMAQGSDLLTEFSIQQILDCTPNPEECGGTGGCLGGTAEIAGAQIIKIGGLATEWTYPYISYFGENATCRIGHKSGPKPVAQVESWVKLTSNDYTSVFDAIATKGPQAISVDASAWHSYESGVFDGCNQTNPVINHAVQLVGYGTDATNGDYWLVRNSWSALWGDAGYIKLARTKEARCGTDLQPLDGTGCKGGPPTQHVCGTCGILFDVSYPVMK